MLHCFKCGADLPDNVIYCLQCGERLEGDDDVDTFVRKKPSPPEKDTVVLPSTPKTEAGRKESRASSRPRQTARTTTPQAEVVRPTVVIQADTRRRGSGLGLALAIFGLLALAAGVVLLVRSIRGWQSP